MPTSNNNDLISSVDLVYQRTRQDIVTGELAPGAPLRLQELAARNGVSMIPVREALRLLEAEGFVDILQNKGARVAPFSKEDMLDVYRTRLVLETEALRLAVPNATPQVIATARKINEKLGRQKANKGVVLTDDHRRFHLMLYEPSESRWLMRLISSVWDHSDRYRRQVERRVTYREVVVEHERILSAMEAGDADGAAEALRDHLVSSMAIMSLDFDEMVEKAANSG
ncbi:MAG: GntR family transcriptional regulator [Thermomicrobiales bacterium]|nr:GntR family transcriptional regulator [Thermomicrobiales bacterium]